MSRRTWRYWARIAAGLISASIVVTVAFNGVTWATPWRQMLEVFSVSLLFSLCIGPPIAFIMPRLSRRLTCHLAFPWNWAVMIAMMIGVAATGSLLAISLLAAVGYIRDGRVFANWLGGSLKVSIYMTVTFGVVMSAYEIMRSQLDAAALALRTKERDEADARRLAAEAQLASIESRVQPHFLFNTLNSIAALVHDDPNGAERMTGQLAALLRSALDGTSTPLVPLDEELRVVRAYLDIERVRFGDRLRYSVDLGAGTADTMVPRMGLQTLVENSVKYSVSPQRAGAAILVRAAAGDGRLHVSVEDDGPGFDPAIRPEGHGLDLLARRLGMLFDGRASMTVESRTGRTRVSLDLPAVVNSGPETDR
jgi:two-component system, LytTR family, sensor histidine kinase AlgZ